MNLMVDKRVDVNVPLTMNLRSAEVINTYQRGS
jgi:hypothetical protein